MHSVILWCGFLGAWLLFAGPLYQGALELHEEEFERDRLDDARTVVGDQPHVSPWWWLLPPIAYLLSQRNQSRWRKAIWAQLSESDRSALLHFLNKAHGWFLVGGGALLIALKETYELVEEHEWDHAWFWALAVFGAMASVAFVASRLSRGWAMTSDG